MHDRHRAFLLLTCIIWTAGCDYGVQRGQYVVSGGGGEMLANDGGWITTFRGTPSNNLDAPNRLLIAVVFVGPDFRTTGSSHGTYLSSKEVETPIEQFAITWDRRSGIVNIDSAEFDRADGNIFVVRMDRGKVSAEQITTSISSDRAEDILNVVRAALPSDPEIQSLSTRLAD